MHSCVKNSLSVFGLIYFLLIILPWILVLPLTPTGLYEKCFSSTRIHSFISYLVKSKHPHMVDKALCELAPTFPAWSLTECTDMQYFLSYILALVDTPSLPGMPFPILAFLLFPDAFSSFKCNSDAYLTPPSRLSISGICPHKSLLFSPLST